MLKIGLTGHELKLMTRSFMVPFVAAFSLQACHFGGQGIVDAATPSRAPSSERQITPRKAPAVPTNDPTTDSPRQSPAIPERDPSLPPARETGSSALFNHFSDGLFFSLSPTAAVSGPLSHPGNDGAYVSDLFGVILRSADALAHPYLTQGDHRAYYAFLLGSLVVPYHESSLVHFRAVEPLGKRCIASLNAGAPLRKTPELSRVFTRYFKQGAAPLVPNCSQLSPTQGTVQLLSSSDYYSNGIMQVAINWHEDGYVATGAFLRIPDTLTYGLQIFHRGFDAVYWNAKSYPCLKRTGGAAGDPVNYKNLIRGAWAGVYNSGNLSSTCRFENARSPWRNNDVSFLSHLDAILTEGKSPFSRYMGGLERAAFDELLTNFRTGSNRHQYLDRLINL
jgi:hypothetical protein